MRAPRSLIWPACLAGVILLALVVAWLPIGPIYNKVLAYLGGLMSATDVSVVPQGASLVLRSQAHGVVVEVEAYGMGLQYGSLLLTALILATPAYPWRNKLKWVLVTWVLFTVLAVAAIAVWSRAIPDIAGGAPVPTNALSLLSPLVFLGFPAIAGGIWCYRYWLTAGVEPSPGVSPARRVRRRRQ